MTDWMPILPLRSEHDIVVLPVITIFVAIFLVFALYSVIKDKNFDQWIGEFVVAGVLLLFFGQEWLGMHNLIRDYENSWERHEISDFSVAYDDYSDTYYVQFVDSYGNLRGTPDFNTYTPEQKLQSLPERCWADTRYTPFVVGDKNELVYTYKPYNERLDKAETTVVESITITAESADELGIPHYSPTIIDFSEEE